MYIMYNMYIMYIESYSYRSFYGLLTHYTNILPDIVLFTFHMKDFTFYFSPFIFYFLFSTFYFFFLYFFFLILFFKKEFPTCDVICRLYSKVVHLAQILCVLKNLKFRFLFDSTIAILRF